MSKHMNTNAETSKPVSWPGRVAVALLVLLVVGAAPLLGQESEAEEPAATEAPAEPAAEEPAGEEAGSEEAGSEETGTEEPAGAEEESDGEKPLIEQWRETLLYGIDSQVEELLPVLADNNETRLNEEVEQLLQTTLNPRLKASIFDFFAQVDADIAVEEAGEILSSYRDEEGELVRAVISYLRNGEFETPGEVLETVHPMTTDRVAGFAGPASRLLGEKGGEAEVAVLLEALEQARDSELRGQIVLALGDLGSDKAVDPLLEIAGNDGNSRLLRGYAADSLGRIGDEKAIDVLREMVSSQDALVRGYAISALSRFEGENVEQSLMSALRDSVWRVRDFALQGIARNGITEAVPAVIYKAREDPEARVRSRAFETLVRLGTEEARSFVTEYVLEASNPLAERRAAAGALIEHALGESIGTLTKLVEQEWSARQATLVGYVAKELSQKEEPALSDLYAKFLTHSDPGVQVYGLRGIARNEISGLKDRVREKTDEGNHPAVRQNAETALEQL